MCLVDIFIKSICISISFFVRFFRCEECYHQVQPAVFKELFYAAILDLTFMKC